MKIESIRQYAKHTYDQPGKLWEIRPSISSAPAQDADFDRMLQHALAQRQVIDIVDDARVRQQTTPRYALALLEAARNRRTT